MKLYEAMKLLDINRTNVYEAKMNDVWKVRMTAKDGSSGHYHFEVFNDKRLIEQSLSSGAFNDNAAMDLDWQLVREPVTWQEAIEAWVDGREVSYSYGGYDRRSPFEGSNTMRLTIQRIKEAKWYVED